MFRDILYFLIKHMKNYLLLFIILYSISGFCQNTYTISGFVRDGVTGEELIGATIYNFRINEIIITNENGFYSITLPQGLYVLEFSYIGYAIKTDTITINKHINHSIVLQKTSIELNKVIVSSSHFEVSSHIKKMPLQQIEQTPTIFGVPDVIKVLQLQPGIKNIGDGSSGMYVRGGNRDQNMILIDDATIYNVSHMFGYVSAINPTMLKDATFYNSNIPTEYGGRISSVLDTKMKEGNMNSNSGEIGLSFLTIDGNIEGPIKKDTSSYFFAIRKSVLDIFMNKSKKGFEVPVFYDINAKINYKINSKNRLFLSAYNGSDIFITQDSKNISQNLTSTIRWFRVINPKLLVNSSYIFSKYSNNTIFQINDSETNWKTGITDNTIKTKISWFPNTNNTFHFGAQIQYHNCIPGNSGYSETSISNMNIFENGLFAMHKIKISKTFTIDYGIRLQSYLNSGKGVWYSLNENYEPIKPNYESNISWNSVYKLEPRISLLYKLQHSEFSLHYNKVSQAMQILSNNAFAYTSIETWISISPNIKPLTSNNYSCSYAYNHKGFAGMIEGYMRKIENQIDYIDHAQLFSNPYIESEIRIGSAKAYGIEVSLHKTQGKTKISSSYSYARVLYTIPTITNSKTYRAPYDMPHDIKIQLNQNITTRISCSAIWIYTSGRPGTFPRGYYYIATNNGNVEIPIYSERNADSYPNYHRLDIAIKYNFKERKKIEHSISFGVYNVYGRVNPLSYTFNNEQQIVTVTYFNYTMPSLTYVLKFK